MHNFNEKIKEMGLTLPSIPTPIASYINCVRTGNLLYLSGGLPFEGERKIIGKVPDVISIEQAQEAAKMIILNRLSVIQSEIGDLNKIKKIVTVNGFVNSSSTFTEHPKVINAASELLLEIFGEECGKHSRTAVGANSLPLDASVEINFIVEIQD